MPSKTEEYLALAQRTANGLTRYWESWTDYLTTAFNNIACHPCCCGCVCGCFYAFFPFRKKQNG